MILQEHEAQNLREVATRWRTDALEFLHVKAPKIIVTLLLAGILIWVLRWMTGRLRKFSESKSLTPGLRHQQLRTLSSFIYSFGMFVIVFLTLLEILPIIGINMGPLLASAGIAGLAIGFGAQTLVHDFINGFFILLENQYDIGDVVKVAGVQGTVERMTLRSTLVRDDQGGLSTIPNSKIDIVTNLTRDWAQIALHIAVAYDEPSDKVIDVLKQVGVELRSDPEYGQLLVADPQVPGIEKVSAGEVDYLMLLKTRPGQQYAITRQARRRIKECFEKNNIKPAGPSFVLRS
jgi:small conductance mechanosensitive channel